MNQEFTFLDPEKLVDGELELILAEKKPAIKEKKYVPSYNFKLHNNATNEDVGHINLRIGTEDELYYVGHIGYGVDEKYRGHHYASRGCKLIFDFVRRHGLQSVWLTCNPDNYASRRTIEIISGKLIEEVELPEDSEMRINRGETRKLRYKIDL